MGQYMDHPTPDCRRSNWHSLNGPWDFAFDDDDIGVADRWYDDDQFPRTSSRITVPFAYQTEASGIHDTTRHDVVWYHRIIKDQRDSEGQRLLLHFGAVDYEADVWVEGQHAAHHIGGHAPFSVDVTDLIDGSVFASTALVVRVKDLYDQDQPRGKQYWGEQPQSIWYHATTGIWQTVWLEVVNLIHFDAASLAITPDFDRGLVTIEVDVLCSKRPELVFEVEAIVSRDRVVAKASRPLTYGKRVSLVLRVGDSSSCIREGETTRDFEIWWPHSPALYDVELRLTKSEGEVVDTLESYFGMRKVSIEGGKFCLNGVPFYQRLVLDQGYWPSSGMTAPDDDAFKKDIELAKSFGFNGCRKHQKPEDPRFYYWADRLGFLVWAEFADCYAFTPRAITRTHNEWSALIRRDLNHPSIVVWLIINESWGVPNIEADQRQVNHCTSLVHLTKALDPSRLVVASDGWHTVAASDLLTLHDYSATPKLLDSWSRIEEIVTDPHAVVFAKNRVFAPGERYRGQPIILSETGGFALEPDLSSEEQGANLLKRVADLAQAFKYAQGFCYTQLTDVQQEINGLAYVDRTPKVAPGKVKAILECAVRPDT